MKVRPLHDRLVVRRDDEPERRVGGIIIPDSAKEKPQQGTVIAAGHGKTTDAGKRIRLDVHAGDRILFGKFAGQEVTLNGEEYLIMKADDVLAIVEGGATKRMTTKTVPKKSKAVVSKGASKKKAQRTPNKKR